MFGNKEFETEYKAVENIFSYVVWNENGSKDKSQIARGTSRKKYTPNP